MAIVAAAKLLVGSRPDYDVAIRYCGPNSCSSSGHSNSRAAVTVANCSTAGVADRSNVGHAVTMVITVGRLIGLSLSWATLSCPVIAFAGTPTPFSPTGEVVLFRGATLIDGTGGPPRANMDVLVAGAQIVKVFSDSALKEELAGKARVVDLRGRYLMPGMIDSHVHLATPPNRRQAEAMLRRDLYGGVTAVRDMADDLRAIGDITRATLVGEIAGADVYYAALMAGPDLFTDKRTVQVTAGAVPGQVPWMQAITNATDLPLAVAEARGTYATAIKLYADLAAGQVAKITAEAHRQQMLVWAHATLFPAKPSEIVSAGVDTISHACLLVRESDAPVPRFGEPRFPVPLGPFRNGQNPALARLFADMIRRGTILDATVWTYGPPDPVSTTSPPQPAGCDDVVGGAITGQAWRAGVQISAGTDAVAPWTDRWPDLFSELDKLVANAGLSPAAVIHSATLIGARAAGQDRVMGSIEAGKLANMVVLVRNPLETLANLKTVVMTVKRGRIFERQAFVPLAAEDITDL